MYGNNFYKIIELALKLGAYRMYHFKLLYTLSHSQ